MKGFVGVMDNDWCTFLAQQPLLPKTPRPKHGGQALQRDGGQALLNKYSWLPILMK